MHAVDASVDLASTLEGAFTRKSGDELRDGGSGYGLVIGSDPTTLSQQQERARIEAILARRKPGKGHLYSNATLPIIKRVNRDSKLVMLKPSVSKVTPFQKAASVNGLNVAEFCSESSTDLGVAAPLPVIPLVIRNKGRYFESPGNAANTASAVTVLPSGVAGEQLCAPASVVTAPLSFIESVRAWEPHLHHAFPSAALASECLAQWSRRLVERNDAGETASKSAKLAAVTGETVLAALPPSLRPEVKMCFNAVTELLRHFWSCVGKSDTSSTAKAAGLVGRMAREYEKLKVYYLSFLPFLPLLISHSRCFAHIYSREHDLCRTLCITPFI